MAHIIIHVTRVSNSSEAGDITYSGYCRCDGMSFEAPDIGWSIDVAASALAATINTGMKNAAIAAALANDPSYEVEALDKKTLVGGAVGL